MQPDKIKDLELYLRVKELLRRFRELSRKEVLRGSLILDVDGIRRNLKKGLVIKQVENGYYSKYFW